ncbi:hypothetical protein LTR78_007081 [Recurvomyces mirabilis]|uniref:Putative transcription factor kapC n=1 Tax=Recurvomyces mirabilis TaxID=574656 RepID=A0AAE0WJP7_9PEZI|nr:hypothetical protein LTR78_007081 [Recurvomyces mirabilis]KAK5150947.1 hypothetical protein LTS14_009751 [Recurvomyces mirabilis]
MSLREQLLAADNSAPNHSPYPPPPTAGAAGPEHPYTTGPGADPTNSHDHLDPNAAHQQQVPYAQMSGDDGGDDGLSPQGSKNKRELSTSKRAAQNRAAQRAFRQRKEGYIKKLEEQVKEFQNMESNYRSLQNENYQLREYILSLQSRLLESSSDIPPAPAQVSLQTTGPSAASNRPPPETSEHGYSAGASRESAQPPAGAQRRDETMQDAMSLSHLQAAAAQAEAASRPQHESPYGLGAPADYGAPRPTTRMEEGGSDVKAAS